MHATVALAVLLLAANLHAARITVEATVPGDSREAGIEAVQAALRAVVDSAVVRVIGPELWSQFPRDIEARIHARRRAFVTHFNIPYIPPERDTPYDGRTYRRITAEVDIAALADSLAAMGLAWINERGIARPCAPVTVNLAGFSPEEGEALVVALLERETVARRLGPAVSDAGPQERFLVPGDAWTLARALGQLGGKKFAVAAVQGNIIDVQAGDDSSQRPSETRRGLPPLEIRELWIDEVFPARHALYRTKAVGRIVLARHQGSPASRSELEIICPEYLDVPLTLSSGELPTSAPTTLPLVIPFSSGKLMRTRTDTQAMIRVVARCWGPEGRDEAASTATFVVHGRNAIDWEDVQSACAFVTPEAVEVQRTTRAAAGFNLSRTDALPGRMELGFKVIRALTSCSLHYVADPTSTGSAYDRVQFAGETLELRSGDCEDTAVLLASCLEGGDVPAELLLTRDHAFAAFSTGLYEKDGFLVSPDRDRYLVRDGVVWLPIETTLLSKGFLPAWDEGVRTIREIEESGEYLERVNLRQGWKTYPPATPETMGDVGLPNDQGAQIELDVWAAQRQRGLAAIERGLRASMEKQSDDHDAAYRLAVLLGRTGRIDEAKSLFARIPDGHARGAWARVGDGNCELIASRADSAVSSYTKATELAPDDPVPWVNLGVAFQVAGDAEGAAVAIGRALGAAGGNEDALARLLGTSLDELSTKAADAESKRALTAAEMRALMERAREAHAGKRVAQRGPSRHKFAGRKALDPEQRLKAERLICWPEPPV
ncbi:MAG: tetratricopeptide repeat protein [Candidatus Eisenbacteria bacterium]|nr:tetratricopeptide repeat protein [Candidatus Eisenbacteria bacterium]